MGEIKFVLDPQAVNHSLVRADLEELFKDVFIRGKENKYGVSKVMKYIETHKELWAPYVVSFSNGRIFRMEGNHRLQALRNLGYKKIMISVPKETTEDFIKNQMWSMI